MDKTLRKCILFQGLQENELETLYALGKAHEYQPEEFIFQENEPGTTLYVILSGSVSIKKKTYKGEEEELATLKAGNFFGEMAILDEQVRSATVQATEPTRCFLIQRDGLELLVAKNPSFLTELAKVLVARLRAADNKISRMERAQNMQEKIVESLVSERQRIALDLHDGPIQTISALTMQLSMLKRKQKNVLLNTELSHMTKTCQLAVKKMREVVFNLYPRTLEEKGIKTAMQDRLEEIEKESGLHFSLEGEWIDIPPSLSRILFSLFLESLNNTLKHAQATLISVRLSENDKEWELRVSDNGKGVEQAELEKKLERKSHYGIKAMQTRVKSLSGSFQFQSELDKGTTLTIRIPKTG